MLKTRAAISPSASTTKFDVCFSYASEDHELFVKRIRVELEKLKLKVFDYQDPTAKAELAGQDLFEKIEAVYRKRSVVCVIFISQSYRNKFWTGRELEDVQTRAWTEERDYLVPVRCDDTELPGLPPWVVVEDIRPGKTTAKQVAGLIADRVRKLKWKRRSRFLRTAVAPLILIAAALYLYQCASHTGFQILDAGRESILVNFQNAGKSSSTLAECKLKFDKGGMKVTQDYLELAPLPEKAQPSQGRVEIPPGATRLRLAARTTVKVSCTPADVCSDEVLRQLASRPLTLTIEVRESGLWHIWRFFGPKRYMRTESREIPDQLRERIKYFFSGACCDEQQ